MGWRPATHKSSFARVIEYPVIVQDYKPLFQYQLRDFSKLRELFRGVGFCFKIARRLKKSRLENVFPEGLEMTKVLIRESNKDKCDPWKYLK